MYKCPYCDFESMNQKNLDIHIKEKHPDANGSQQKQEIKQKPPKPKILDDLSRSLVNSNVRITFMDNSVMDGLLTQYSRFEFRLTTFDNRDLIVLKGSIKYIEKLQS